MTNKQWSNGIQTVDEKRAIKRQAILRVAARAFNQQGFTQTTLTNIAEQLNVTKPSLYYYVANKDDILTGILEEAITQLRSVINHVTTVEASGLEKLRDFFFRYSEVVTDDFGACLVLMRINAPAARFRDHYNALSYEVLQAAEQFINDGINDGSITPCDPKYTASALLGTMNETVYWHVVEDRESPKDTAVRFFTIFETGLRQ